GKGIPYFHVIVNEDRYLQRGGVEPQLLDGITAEQVDADVLEAYVVLLHQEPGHQGGVGTTAVTADQVQCVRVDPSDCLRCLGFRRLYSSAILSQGRGGGRA